MQRVAGPRFVADREATQGAPDTEAELRDGALSQAQASAVSKAAEAAPAAEGKLLRSARRDSLRELRERADRVIAANTDEVEAHAKAKRERHLRTWRDGMATRGSFSGPTEVVAELLRALEPIEQALFERARKDPDERREPYEARRFDALITLARGDLPEAAADAGPPVTRLRIDLDRLLDHDPCHDPDHPGEVCEIPGVGPVPVAHARDVLPHGLLELVITDGVEVQTVVSRTRHVPEALKVAVAERDQRCKVRGCDRTHRLERHHTEPFAEHQITSYDVLGMLCGDHHNLVTYRSHEIIDHGDGTWSLEAPDHDAEERRDPDAA